MRRALPRQMAPRKRREKIKRNKKGRKVMTVLCRALTELVKPLPLQYHPSSWRRKKKRKIIIVMIAKERKIIQREERRIVHTVEGRKILLVKTGNLVWS